MGFPNAGKSTLLSSISEAKPKIADYPFTTLVPNLGIVGYRSNQSFVMADIPGIIEGASEGRGLGLRFLRHIERNAVLLFMIPADTDDNEVSTFNPQLENKPRVLAITKCDMLDDELIEEMRQHLPDGVPTVFISSVSGLGIQELKDLLWLTINDENNKIDVEITHRDLDMSHRVQEEDEFVFENEPISDEEAVEEEEWDDEYWEEDHIDDDYTGR